MDRFKIKKDDLDPALRVTLQDNTGSAIDLTSSTIYFIMGNLNDYSAYYSGAATVINSTEGKCEYRWDATSTGSVGTYWGEFEVSWTGSKLTLPSDHSLQVQVFEDYN